MAYSTDNPPFLISEGVGGTQNRRVWMYVSTDTATAVRVSGYITDGYDLGMRAGDIVLSVDTDASPIAAHLYVVSSASSSAVDLSDGTAITATNTD
jgi:hypothetical protein